MREPVCLRPSQAWLRQSSETPACPGQHVSSLSAGGRGTCTLQYEHSALGEITILCQIITIMLNKTTLFTATKFKDAQADLPQQYLWTGSYTNTSTTTTYAFYYNSIIHSTRSIAKTGSYIHKQHWGLTSLTASSSGLWSSGASSFRTSLGSKSVYLLKTTYTDRGGGKQVSNPPMQTRKKSRYKKTC